MQGQGSDTLKKATAQDLSNLKFEEKKVLYDQAKKLADENKDDPALKDKFNGDNADEQRTLFYARILQESKITPARTDVTPLQTFVSNDNGATATTALPSGPPVGLKKISKLQRIVYDGELDSLFKELDRSIKDRKSVV